MIAESLRQGNHKLHAPSVRTKVELLMTEDVADAPVPEICQSAVYRKTISKNGESFDDDHDVVVLWSGG